MEETSPLCDSFGSSDTVEGDAPVSNQSQVGPYRLLSLLGEGGMGTVYAAQQLEPVRRRVAIKLIKLGMDTRDVIARFDAERQALAIMNHPNIAQVFDAGASATGRPYFVMELVEGTPLTTYCDSKMLPTSRRLELFAQVCDAVQHAHTKGIIHRDLKPGNVLVTEVDGKPVPKVIDFGIAKAIDQQTTERTLFTEMGRMVGTPEYMSPEQAGKHSGDIDTRTDVYSLGVVLYELLTGTLPFDAATLRSKAYAEVQRIICEVEPMRPSTRLSSVPPADAAPLVGRRRETVASLAGALRRELEWIPLKAMRKVRDHRYRAASELADDVRNYLAGRPLRAGPETRSYQTWKFVRRHRSAVAVAATLVALLFGGVAATTWQAARATHAERVARQEKTDADQQRAAAQRRFEDVRSLSSRMLFELLPDIDRLPGSTSATRKLVDMSLEYLSNLQADQLTDARLLRDVATAYDYLGNVQGNPRKRNLGDVEGAMRSYQRAAGFARQALAITPDDAKSVDLLGRSELHMGEVLARQGQRRQAVEHLKAALAHFVRARELDPSSPNVWSNEIATRQQLAQNQLEEGDVVNAVALMRDAVHSAKAVKAKFPNDPDTGAALPPALDLLANAQGRAGQYNDAIATLREEVALLETAFAQNADDANVRGSLSNATFSLAWTIANQSPDAAAAAAEPLARSIQLSRRAHEIDPLDVSVSGALAHALVLQQQVLTTLNRAEEGERSLNEAVDLLQKGLAIAPTDKSLKQDLIVALGASAWIKTKRGDFADAVQTHELAAQTLAPLVEADPQNVTLQAGLAFTRLQMASTRLEAKDFIGAASDARAASEIQERLLANHPDDVRIEKNLLAALGTEVDALAGTVNDEKSTSEQRGAARGGGAPLLARIRTVAERLLSRGALTPARVETYRKDLQDLEGTFAVEPQDEAAVTQPATKQRS